MYLDTALPFGLRSAPKIFSAVADALTWAMLTEGIHDLLHYLDDYLFLSLPRAPQAWTFLEKAIAVCQSLGVPVASNKIEGPNTALTFLGITIDTVRGELCLPADKLIRLQQTIRYWASKRSCTKRELLSLIGQLQHAATVVRPGRTFQRRMIDLAARFSRLDDHIAECTVPIRSTVVVTIFARLEWIRIFPAKDTDNRGSFRRLWLLGLRGIP